MNPARYGTLDVVDIKGRKINLSDVKNPVLREYMRKAASFCKKSHSKGIELAHAICFGWNKFGAWHNIG